VRDLIRQLKEEGIGIFLISHDIHDVYDICRTASASCTTAESACALVEMAGHGHTRFASKLRPSHPPCAFGCGCATWRRARCRAAWACIHGSSSRSRWRSMRPAHSAPTRVLRLSRRPSPATRTCAGRHRCPTGSMRPGRNWAIRRSNCAGRRHASGAVCSSRRRPGMSRRPARRRWRQWRSSRRPMPHRGCAGYSTASLARSPSSSLAIRYGGLRLGRPAQRSRSTSPTGWCSAGGWRTTCASPSACGTRSTGPAPTSSARAPSTGRG
jgi:hypothetical protein